MTVSNVFSTTDLRGLARQASKDCHEESVHNALVEERMESGWALTRRGKGRSRLSIAKNIQVQFPDRVWSVLYKMGFTLMSGPGGAILATKSETGSVDNQLDIVAIDDDVALYFECRTGQTEHKVPRFAEDVAHLDGLRQAFTRAVKSSYGPRKVAALYWSQNLILTDNDRERAAQKNIKTFTEPELRYYEELTKQIGTAARFQFLADVLEGSKVDSLAVKLPAVSVRIGPTRCFSFAISPERLLKIAYVSHRAKGSATDVETYQRLLRRSRIKDIREYVNAGGYFPTNIVLNIRTRRELQFDKASTPPNVDTSVGNIGWLTLPSEYKSAWIIDGQHRLFAYANSAVAKTAQLSVLAFENLSESEQARLFVDINAKQKSVKQNLLVELWAELHWNSEDPDDRVRAIIAKLALSLDADPSSPFYKRIVRADDPATETRSITLQALSSALSHSEFFLGASKAGVTYGAFWTKDQMKTLRRAATVVNEWFNNSTASAISNWVIGKGEGGALAMNDSVAAILGVLRSVFRHLSSQGIALYELETHEIVGAVSPFASALCAELGQYTDTDFSFYRSLRGVQGQTQRMRELQLMINRSIPAFQPEGLAQYVESRDKNAMAEARTLLDDIELALQTFVINTLKANFGEASDSWWFNGVPKSIRSRIIQEINDEGRDSPRESRFTLIDYRTIANDKWPLFEATLGQGKGSKDKRTAWLARVNEIRKFAAHPTKGTAKLEDVQFLREQCDWLRGQLEPSRILLEPDEGTPFGTSD